jgi:hypothetical protein
MATLSAGSTFWEFIFSYLSVVPSFPCLVTRLSAVTRFPNRHSRVSRNGKWWFGPIPSIRGTLVLAPVSDGLSAFSQQMCTHALEETEVCIWLWWEYFWFSHWLCFFRMALFILGSYQANLWAWAVWTYRIWNDQTARSSFEFSVSFSRAAARENL